MGGEGVVLLPKKRCRLGVRSRRGRWTFTGAGEGSGGAFGLRFIPGVGGAEALSMKDGKATSVWVSFVVGSCQGLVGVVKSCGEVVSA